MSVAEVARRIRVGALTPREAVESYLDRIERADGDLNAYIRVRAEEALAEAGEVPDGPLRGVPMALRAARRAGAQVWTGKQDWVAVQARSFDPKVFPQG